MKWIGQKLVEKIVGVLDIKWKRGMFCDGDGPSTTLTCKLCPHKITHTHTHFPIMFGRVKVQLLPNSRATLDLHATNHQMTHHYLQFSLKKLKLGKLIVQVFFNK